MFISVGQDERDVEMSSRETVSRRYAFITLRATVSDKGITQEQCEMDI